MKLPNLTNNLIKGLQEARSERINTLSQLLSIGMGKTQNALVEKVSPLNSEQRQQLISRTVDTLIELTRNPATQPQSKQVTQLLEQQQLLNSPLLKLVKLQLNHRPVITYTDRPIQPGQTVKVTLADTNRLVLVDNPAGTDSPATKLTRAPTPDQHRTQNHTLLAQALRSVLPLRDRPALLEALPQIQALPLSHRQELLSPSVQQALKSLAQQLRSPSQLAHPKLLQTAIKNNGVFFERKFAQSLADARQAGHPRRLDSSQSARLTSGDVKGALLQLIHRINTDLGTSVSTPAQTSPNPAPGLQLPNVLDLSQLLTQLAQRPAGELNDRALRTQLLMLLHQQSLTSLARVQFQQLHTVNHQQAQADAPQATQSWVLEVPVRQGQENHTLQLQIDQDWLRRDEEEDEKEDQEPRKVRRWQLLLSFPLPQAGNFYAQLTVIGEGVAAKLWAEQPETLQEVRQKVAGLKQQLEDKGIAVTRLECVQGKPPEKTQTLQYALVDIKT